MARIRVFGAAGGAVFALLTLAAFLIAPGPSSANGVMVVEYYTEHGNAAIWQAVLAGFGIVFFVWFAAIFADTMSSANAVLVTAGAMAAVYLVVLGAWESLGENYKDVDIVDVSSESYGDAHVLYDVGVGAAHLAGFADAAFVGATAAVLLTSAPWRRLNGGDLSSSPTLRHVRRSTSPVCAPGSHFEAELGHQNADLECALDRAPWAVKECEEIRYPRCRSPRRESALADGARTRSTSAFSRATRRRAR